jgi:predicted PurR-regulated permease PerM
MSPSHWERESLYRNVLLGALLAAGALFVYMVRGFLVAVFLAAVFTTLFYPLFQRLLRWFRGRRGLASIVCCVVLLLGLLLPLYWVAALVVREAVDFTQRSQAWVRQLVEGGQSGVLERLHRLPWVGSYLAQLPLETVDWRTALGDVAGSAGRLGAELLERTSRGAFTVVVTLFLTLFTMFYLFIDGERILARAKRLSPLGEGSMEAIAKRFAAVARATVRGTLVIGLVQGGLGTLTLWIFDVPSPLLWGVVMVIFSVVPLIGVKIVLVPALLFKLMTGHPLQALGIAIVTFVVILNVDNLLRPRLVGQEAKMHDLMVFFSTLGGLATFGVAGFIIGPVVAAFFLALLEIYESEFRVRAPADAGP